MEFSGSHILSVNQFAREDVDKVFQVADSMRPYANRERITKVLDGAILGNMFFEPSTRTRISFGCAFNLLGGEVRETTGIQNSALAKGEWEFTIPTLTDNSNLKVSDAEIDEIEEIIKKHV